MTYHQATIAKDPGKVIYTAKNSHRRWPGERHGS